jgi:hypothetical protein
VVVAVAADGEVDLAIPIRWLVEGDEAGTVGKEAGVVGGAELGEGHPTLCLSIDDVNEVKLFGLGQE